MLTSALHQILEALPLGLAGGGALLALCWRKDRFGSR